MGKKLVAVLMSLCLACMSLGALAGCGSSSANATKDITDLVIAANAEGIELEDEYTVPESVTKVAPLMGAVAQITAMLTDGDSKMAAAPVQQLSDQFKTIIANYEAGNPDGYDSMSVEDIIAAGCQVAYGPSGMLSDEQKEQLADAGVTFIPLTNLGTVDGVCAVTECIGAILGDDEYNTACEFTKYWKGNVTKAEELTADLSDNEKPVVLNLAYSNGAYTCESGDTMIGSYIAAAGGISCTDDYEIVSTGGQNGGAALDAEQICAWNPDYIICYSTDAVDAVMADKALSGVTAVKEGNVVAAPKGLYLWPVRSGEGSLMVLWIGTLIHPDLFADVDIAQETKDFFKKYYDYDLSDDEVSSILAGTF